MKSSDEIIESIISGVGGDIFLKDESLDIDFRNCQPISTCTIFDYHNNDYLSGDADQFVGGSLVIGEAKKNKRKSTTPKRSEREGGIGSGSGNDSEEIFKCFSVVC